MMYKIFIDGVYYGHYQLLEKAKDDVERWAKPQKRAWKIEGPDGEVLEKSQEEAADNFSKPIQ